MADRLRLSVARVDDRADDFEVRIFVNAAVFAADQYDLEVERAESDHWSQHTPATLAAAIAETLRDRRSAGVRSGTASAPGAPRRTSQVTTGHSTRGSSLAMRIAGLRSLVS